MQGQTLDILWVFDSVQNIYHREFIQPHDGWITNPTTRWFHHTVGFSFFTTLNFKILSTDSHPTNGRDCGSPHLVGFFYFTTNHTNLNISTKGGLLSDHDMEDVY